MFTKENIQLHLVSALQTFITSFIVILGSTVAQGHIIWSPAFIWGLVFTVSRAAIKELFTQYAPPALGGKKK